MVFLLLWKFWAAMALLIWNPGLLLFYICYWSFWMFLEVGDFDLAFISFVWAADIDPTA